MNAAGIIIFLIRAARPCTSATKRPRVCCAHAWAKGVDVSDIPTDERRAYEEDFAELERGGILFAPETQARPIKSDEVKALCLHICHDCNLRCRYCFADEGAYHSRREFMSLETAKKAIDFLIANSGDRRVLETDFFGGEPLMNFDVVKETVYYAKAEAAKRGKEFRFTLTTNGLLLKDEIAEFLNREMDNVVLSLDGRKEVHDAVRKTANGKGSFDLVIENLKNFVQIRGDKSYYVRGTFTAKNLDFAKDVLFLADSGFDSISLEPVVTDIPDLAIGAEQLPRIASGVRQAVRRLSCPPRGREGLLASSISTSIWRAGPASPSA